jgi:maltooligosyltrehalose trehalohydrolase
MFRGSLAIACNLGTDTVDVPVSGEVVLAWSEPIVGAETTQLQAHSFVILRPREARIEPSKNYVQYRW